MWISRGRNAAICAAALLAFTGAAARADSISDPAMMVTATSAQGSASLMITLSDGVWSGRGPDRTWTWRSQFEYQLYDPVTGAQVGMLKDLFCEMVADPQVTVNFTAVSGMSDTTFTFSSGLLSYAPITGSTAFATAGATVTDNDSNGATLTGLFGGDAFQATYNGASVFDTLIGSFSVPVDNSLAISDRSPASGQTAIGTTSSMQADWWFTLSANDQVGGTSRFSIVPAPGALGLMGAAGLVAIRRRR